MPQPSRLFKPFSLTDCLDQLSESPYDSVIPGTSFSGLVALAGLVFSLACFYCFSSWAARATAHACQHESGLASEMGDVPELRVNGV